MIKKMNQTFWLILSVDNNIFQYIYQSMEGNKTDIINKIGLYLHWAANQGYEVIDYYPPPYHPIFCLTCSLFCSHQAGCIANKCCRCGEEVKLENLFRDTFMQSFPSPVRIDLTTRQYIFLPVSKPSHEWTPLNQVPCLHPTHIKYLKCLRNPSLTHEQKFELENYYHYQLLPKVQPRSFLRSHLQHNPPKEQPAQTYRLQHFYPDPTVQPFYRQGQKYGYQLVVGEDQIIYPTNIPIEQPSFSPSIEACCLHHSFLFAIIQYMEEVHLFILQRTGLEYNSPADMFLVLHNIQIHQQQPVDQQVQQQYTVFYDYSLDADFENVYVSINQYCQMGTKNYSQTLQIGNILKRKPEVREIGRTDYAHFTYEKMYTHSCEGDMWKFLLNKTTLKLWKQIGTSYDFPNEGEIRRILNIHFDPLKGSFQMLVYCGKNQFNSQIKYLEVRPSTQQFHLHSLPKQLHHRLCWNSGVPAFHKWYFQCFQSDRDSQNFKRVPFDSI